MTLLRKSARRLPSRPANGQRLRLHTHPPTLAPLPARRPSMSRRAADAATALLAAMIAGCVLGSNADCNPAQAGAEPGVSNSSAVAGTATMVHLPHWCARLCPDAPAFPGAVRLAGTTFAFAAGQSLRPGDAVRADRRAKRGGTDDARSRRARRAAQRTGGHSEAGPAASRTASRSLQPEHDRVALSVRPSTSFAGAAILCCEDASASRAHWHTVAVQRGSGTLAARDDVASVDRSRAVRVDVLANDQAAGGAASRATLAPGLEACWQLPEQTPSRRSADVTAVSGLDHARSAIAASLGQRWPAANGLPGVGAAAGLGASVAVVNAPERADHLDVWVLAASSPTAACDDAPSAAPAAGAGADAGAAAVEPDGSVSDAASADRGSCGQQGCSPHQHTKHAGPGKRGSACNASARLVVLQRRLRQSHWFPRPPSRVAGDSGRGSAALGRAGGPTPRLLPSFQDISAWVAGAAERLQGPNSQPRAAEPACLASAVFGVSLPGPRTSSLDGGSGEGAVASPGLAVGDVDGDGLTDVALQVGGSVELFAGSATGDVSRRTLLADCGRPLWVAPAGGWAVGALGTSEQAGALDGIDQATARQRRGGALVCSPSLAEPAAGPMPSGMNFAAAEASDFDRRGTAGDSVVAVAISARSTNFSDVVSVRLVVPQVSRPATDSQGQSSWVVCRSGAGGGAVTAVALTGNKSSLSVAHFPASSIRAGIRQAGLSNTRRATAEAVAESPSGLEGLGEPAETWWLASSANGATPGACRALSTALLEPSSPPIAPGRLAAGRATAESVLAFPRQREGWAGCAGGRVGSAGMRAARARGVAAIAAAALDVVPLAGRVSWQARPSTSQVSPRLEPVTSAAAMVQCADASTVVLRFRHRGRGRGWAVSRIGSGPALSSASELGQLATADFDGDGLDDVVAHASSWPGPSLMLVGWESDTCAGLGSGDCDASDSTPSYGIPSAPTACAAGVGPSQTHATATATAVAGAGVSDAVVAAGPAGGSDGESLEVSAVLDDGLERRASLSLERPPSPWSAESTSFAKLVLRAATTQASSAAAGEATPPASNASAAAAPALPSAATQQTPHGGGLRPRHAGVWDHRRVPAALPASFVPQCSSPRIASVAGARFGSARLGPRGRVVVYHATPQEALDSPLVDEVLYTAVSRLDGSTASANVRIVTASSAAGEEGLAEGGSPLVRPSGARGPWSRLWGVARAASAAPGAPSALVVSRASSGAFNNLVDVRMGEAFTPLRDDVAEMRARLRSGGEEPEGRAQAQGAASAPGALSAAGGAGSARSLPSGRAISNAVFAQEWPRFAATGLSDAISHFGQLVAHDTDFVTPTADFRHGGNMGVKVPRGDPWMDPNGTGSVVLHFRKSGRRSAAASTAGIDVDQDQVNAAAAALARPAALLAEQVNKVTSWLDASMLYGSDDGRVAIVREGFAGRLRPGDQQDIPAVATDAEGGVATVGSGHGSAPVRAVAAGGGVANSSATSRSDSSSGAEHPHAALPGHCRFRDAAVDRPPILREGEAADVGSATSLQSLTEERLPFNGNAAPNLNLLGRRRETLLLSGDNRANVQPGLLALHTLLSRLHNVNALLLAAAASRPDGAIPDVTSEPAVRVARWVSSAVRSCAAKGQATVVGEDHPHGEAGRASISGEGSSIDAGGGHGERGRGTFGSSDNDDDDWSYGCVAPCPASGSAAGGLAAEWGLERRSGGASGGPGECAVPAWAWSALNDDVAFVAARELTTAQYQSVVVNEYAPLIAGGSAADKFLGPYGGYDRRADGRVTVSFATSAFRFGHSQVGHVIPRLGPSWCPLREDPALELRVGYFAPWRTLVTRGRQGVDGVDSLLRGMVVQPAQAADALAADDVRNLLFGPGVGFDLIAFNVQRGRDHGAASFADLRRVARLDPPGSMGELVAGRAGATLSADQQALAAALRAAYGTDSAADVDAIVGALAEHHGCGTPSCPNAGVEETSSPPPPLPPPPAAAVGPTVAAIVLGQLRRLRDADRFWFEGAPGAMFSDAGHIASLRGVRFAHLLRAASSAFEGGSAQGGDATAGQMAWEAVQRQGSAFVTPAAVWARGPGARALGAAQSWEEGRGLAGQSGPDPVGAAVRTNASQPGAPPLGERFRTASLALAVHASAGAGLCARWGEG